eukprot:scaffold3929_cov291-Pinguiococcus_pyrenoidosus.AAC.9
MQTLQVQKEKLFSDIWVHADLHENLMPVYSHILHEVAELQAKHPRYTLYVAGHSLGGAFATLFGFRAANDLPELAIHVVSFGSPRIGRELDHLLQVASLPRWRIPWTRSILPS